MTLPSGVTLVFSSPVTLSLIIAIIAVNKCQFFTRPESGPKYWFSNTRSPRMNVGGCRTKNRYLRAQFLRLKSRRGPKKAILAVAASMLTAASYILKDSVTYAELGAAYFEHRSKTQTARRLVKRLESLGLIL